MNYKLKRDLTVPIKDGSMTIKKGGLVELLKKDDNEWMFQSRGSYGDILIMLLPEEVEDTVEPVQ